MRYDTFKTLTTSLGNCIRAAFVTFLYIRSTKIPALIACATDLNFGFSSVFRLDVANCLVNVDASHSRTSGGTASGCTSLSSSSSSTKRLKRPKKLTLISFDIASKNEKKKNRRSAPEKRKARNFQFYS